MKTPIKTPGALFRRAKPEAPAANPRLSGSGEKPWMEAFGKLRHLHKETARSDRIIEEEFCQIEPEDWK